MIDKQITEDLEYYRGMAQDYGEKLDELYNIIKISDWINIGNKSKRSIEKMYTILQDYKMRNQ